MCTSYQCVSRYTTHACGPECLGMTERVVDASATRTARIRRTRADRQHQAMRIALRERTRRFVIHARLRCPSIHPSKHRGPISATAPRRKQALRATACIRPPGGPTDHEHAPRDAPARKQRSCLRKHIRLRSQWPIRSSPTQGCDLEVLNDGSESLKITGAASVRFRTSHSVTQS